MHRSAKTRRENAAAAAPAKKVLTTPEAVVSALITQARAQYRQGFVRQEVELRVRSDNFSNWTDQDISNPTSDAFHYFVDRLGGELRKLLKRELSPGTRLGSCQVEPGSNRTLVIKAKFRVYSPPASTNRK